jgi:hypothetical protein
LLCQFRDSVGAHRHRHIRIDGGNRLWGLINSTTPF